MLKRALAGIIAALPYAVAATIMAVAVGLRDPAAFGTAQTPTLAGLVAFYFSAAVAVGAVWGMMAPWATTLAKQTLASIPAAIPFAAAVVIGLIHEGDVTRIGQTDVWLILGLPFLAGPIGVLSFHVVQRSMTQGRDA